jgi:hypothetical protein
LPRGGRFCRAPFTHRTLPVQDLLPAPIKQTIDFSEFTALARFLLC